MSSEESKFLDQDDADEKDNFFGMVKIKTGQKIKPIIQSINGKFIIIGYHGPKHPWDPYRTFTIGHKDWHNWGNVTYFVDNFKKWAETIHIDNIINIGGIITDFGIEYPVAKKPETQDISCQQVGHKHYFIKFKNRVQNPEHIELHPGSDGVSLIIKE